MSSIYPVSGSLYSTEVERDDPRLRPKSVRNKMNVSYDDATGLYVTSVDEWIGKQTQWLPDRPDLYIKHDGHYWAAAPFGQGNDTPRSSLEAVKHIVSYLEFPYPLQDWSDRGMGMVARAFGLDKAGTANIPVDVPGKRMSASRQFFWMRKYHPDMTVKAPSANSFGYGVPIGAVLYWDSDSGSQGYGRAAVAAGYINGILLCFTTIRQKGCDGTHLRLGIDPLDPAMRKRCLHVDIVPAYPWGALGWTLPMFHQTPGIMARSLWEPPDLEVES